MKLLKKIDWLTFPFFSLTLLTAIIGLIFYVPKAGIHPLEPIYCFVSVCIIAFVVAGGYHRYFSHKTYSCHPILKIFYLVVGAAAFEQSALIWSADHRRHHKYVDTERDPYNIKKGFWWAHIGWILTKAPPERGDFSNVPDLLQDRWVMWQHRYLLPLGIGLGFGLPLVIGFLIDRPVGMFLWGAVLRIVITHHTTSTINSIAHKFGTQPYTDQNSARDVWWLAPFLCGETYHNYHHCFQWDYRNGVRWYHWDPAKWVLWLLSQTFLVTNLRRVPADLILKARLKMDLKRLESRLSPTPNEFWAPFHKQLNGMRQKLEETAECYSKALKSYHEFKKNVSVHSKESVRQLKRTVQNKRDNLKKEFNEWKETIRSVSRNPIQR